MLLAQCRSRPEFAFGLASVDRRGETIKIKFKLKSLPAFFSFVVKRGELKERRKERGAKERIEAAGSQIGSDTCQGTRSTAAIVKRIIVHEVGLGG